MSNIEVFDLEGSSPCAEYLHVLFGKVFCSEWKLWISNFTIRCLNTCNYTSAPKAERHSATLTEVFRDFPQL